VTEVDILSIDGAHAIAIWRNFVAQIYEGNLDPVAFRKIAETTLGGFRRVRAQVGPKGAVVGIVVVAPTAPVPDGATRGVMVEFVPSFDYVVTVPEGGAVRSAIIRSVNSGLALVRGARAHQHDVAQDVPTAAGMIAKRSGGSATAQEIEALVSTLRDRVATLARRGVG
jgi:hypothetical protein